MLVFSRDNSLPSNVTNLLPGSRCILPNGKEYILNNSKQWIPIHMMAMEFKLDLTTENLNSITSQGIYHNNLNSQATLVNNYPTTQAGVLIVYKSNDQIFQQYQILSGQPNENKIYSRGQYGGVWSPWIVPNYVNITQTEWNTILTNSHTHTNKSNLDSINQNLGTTNSPTFGYVTISNGIYNDGNYIPFLKNDGQSQKAGFGGILISDNYTDYTLIPTNGIYSKGQITTGTHGNSSQWNQAFGWGNHADFGYTSQTWVNNNFVKLSSITQQNLNSDVIVIKDTNKENITFLPTGTSYGTFGFNKINLSGFGLFSNLINNTDKKFWIGYDSGSIIKLIEYDLITDRFRLGIDKPIYLNNLTLGTSGTKTLTVDESGRLSYIEGLPSLDSNVVHKTGDENINGIKTFNDKTVFTFIEIPLNNQLTFENIASYGNDIASITGNWKITLPIINTTSNNTMFFMRIYIYNYGPGINQGLVEGTISGYIYNNTWVQPKISFPGNVGISQVRLGKNTTNNPVIFIDNSIAQTYPKLIIKELQISFDGQSDVNWKNKTLWYSAITLTTDNTGFTLHSTILNSSFSQNIAHITWGTGLTVSPTGKYTGNVAQTITPTTANGSTLGMTKAGTGTTVVSGAINVTYGTAANTAAQGNDSRFHNAVTLGTANGLSLSTQVLSLDLATTSTSGAMSASDKTKLDSLLSETNGTVTSVGLTMPTGFTVSNTPITSNGNINVALNAGYYIPTTTDKTKWDDAYSWGNHAGLYATVAHNHTIANITNLQYTLDGKVDLTSAQTITGIKNFQNGFDINAFKYLSIGATNVNLAGAKNAFGNSVNTISDSAFALGNDIFPVMNLQPFDPVTEPWNNRGYVGIGSAIFINYAGDTIYNPGHNAHDSWIGIGRALGAGFIDGTNVTMLGTTNMHRNDVKYAEYVTVVGKGFSNGIKTRADKTLDPNRVVTTSNGINVHARMSDVIGIGHENWVEDISHSVVVGSNLRPYSYVFNSLVLGSNHTNMNYEGTQAQADMYLDSDVIIGMGVQKRSSRHPATNNLLIGMDGYYTMGSVPNPNYRPLVEGTFKNAKFQVNGVVIAGHELPNSDKPNETATPLTVDILPDGVTFNSTNNTFTFDGSQTSTEFKIGQFVANTDVSVYIEVGTTNHTAGTWGSTINNFVDSGNAVGSNYVSKQAFIVYNNSDFKLSTAGSFEGTIYVKYIKTDLLGTGVLANYQTKDSYENLTSEIRGGTMENGHLSFGLNSGKFLHLGTKSLIFGNNAYTKGVSSTNSVIIGHEAAKNNIQSIGDVIIGAGVNSNSMVGTGSVVLIGLNSLKNPLQRITNTVTVGKDTLLNLQYGSYNTTIGASAGSVLLNGQSNVFVGRNAGLIKNGNNNIFLGETAGGYDLMESTVNNTIVIGSGIAPEVPNNTTTIGGAANTDNFLYGTTHSNAFKVRGGTSTQVLMADGSLKEQSTFGSTTIPSATSTVVGGIKLFSDTVQNVASNAVSATASRTYGVQVNSSGQMVVNVPWVDTNTVYTHPNSGVTAGTYKSVTVNAQGHITAGTNPTTIAGYGITDALKINLTGSLSNLSGTGSTFVATTTNTAWFDYNWANTGIAGSVINFSGLTGGYNTEIFSNYSDGNYIGFRTRNGDNNAWNPVRQIWHDGNFTPSNFLTQETDPTVPTHVKNISTGNIAEWNESFKRRTSFVSNIDANDKSFLSGYYSIETANGTGNTNFPSNSAYGVFSRMTSNYFTTDIFYYNAGDMVFRTFPNPDTPSNWRVVWDNVNLTKLSQLSNDSGYLTSSALSPYAQTSWVNANFDKYASWNLQTNNVQRTSMPSGSNLNLVAGANVTINYSAGGTVTISATDTDTNTTYALGTTAQLNTGTDTSAKVWSAKAISDWANAKYSLTSHSHINYMTNDTSETLPSGVVKAFTNASNEYYGSGIQLMGNGSANTIFPSIAFHQPGLYAGNISLRSDGYHFRGNPVSAGLLPISGSAFKAINESNSYWVNYDNNGIDSNQTFLRFNGNELVNKSSVFLNAVGDETIRIARNNEYSPSIVLYNLNASANDVLKNATYGTYGGFVQGAAAGSTEEIPNNGVWYNKIKILHNNSEGYFTEFAMPFTDANQRLYFRSMINGTRQQWKQIAYIDDITTIGDSNYVNINGNQNIVGTKTFISQIYANSGVSVNSISLMSGYLGDEIGLIDIENEYSMIVKTTSHYNIFGESCGNVANNGFVKSRTNYNYGIDATPNASYKLSVGGSIFATSFLESSLRELKTNIEPFNKSALDLMSSLNIVTFDRKDNSAKNKIGIIADDSPKEFLSEELDSVDLYNTIFIQAKAIQELTKRIEELENKLK